MKRKASRIGILTFHNGPNYGGFLQAWHMRNAVRKAGYRCDVVNYLHPDHVLANQVSIPLRSLAGLKANAHWALKRWPFRSIEKSLCTDPFTSNSSEVPWKSFAGLVVGSDVVWDYQNPAYGHDPVYFGEAPEMRDTPIMSYAASAGSADTSQGVADYCQGLKRFVHHAVRGRPALKLVEEVTGKSPSVVVDPTWLYPDPETPWKRLPQQPYLLVYGTGLTAESAVLLKEWCRTKGLLLVTAATPCATADRVYRMLAPFQWVELFRHATATVVGSLHGTMYSIKYGKPFILLNNPQTRKKVSLAVDKSGTGFRMVNPGNLDFEALKLLEPDHHPLPSIPEDWRQESLDNMSRGLALIAGSEARTRSLH